MTGLASLPFEGGVPRKSRDQTTKSVFNFTPAELALVSNPMQALDNPDSIVREVEHAVARLAAVREAVGRVIFGQRDVVDQVLITMLAGGHGLLVGVPGLAKTRLVDALGTVLGMATKRVQFTPDLTWLSWKTIVAPRTAWP